MSKGDLAERVYEVIIKEKMVKAGDLILVAFSGGPDSLALLHILRRLQDRLKIKLAAAHLDHGLRGEESAAESQWVQELCKQWQISCYVGYWDGLNNKKTGESPEEAARKARLKFLEEQKEATGAAVIAQGHHGDDQVETMIIRLLNGTGLRGLGGIKAVRPPYIRPLIYCSRRDIMDYCRAFDLNPRIDSSNYSDVYLRNQIRHELIPLLKKYNPRLIETLSRTAKVLQSEDEFLDRLAAEALQKVLVNKQDEGEIKEGLDLASFNAVDEVLARRVIRLWVGAELDFAGIQRVLDLARQGKVGGVAELAGPWAVKRGYNDLRLWRKSDLFKDNTRESAESWPMAENCWVAVGGGEAEVNCRLVVREEDRPLQETIKDLLKDIDEEKYEIRHYCIPWEREAPLPVWRRRLPGDWIQFNYGRKKLKRWLIDRKIPAEKRDKLLCLAWQQQILWVPELVKGTGPFKKQPGGYYLLVCIKKIR